jgi:cyclopropane-fatty-acyl-phospholipid synthase
MAMDITHTSTDVGIAPSTTHPIDAARAVLGELFGPPAYREFRVHYWDGTVEGPDTGAEARFAISLDRPGALRRMLIPPSELALGEAYLRGDFDVDGSLEAATGLADRISERLRSPGRVARLVPLLRALPRDEVDHAERAAGRTGRRLGLRHTRGRDRTAVRSHYDVGNAFYALWLDRRMVYSCGYFETPETSLDAAQLAKIDHICRKLRLRPGDRLLDIGCGWGGLIIHAAERYGVDATGITLSEPQATLASERIAAAGLQDRCRVEVRDYRELPEDAAFDKIASVGMVEHVGRARLDRYFAEARRLLRPGGLFLNHGIVERPVGDGGVLALPHRLLWRPRAFLDRYVFPDGELVRTDEIIAHAEGAGLETRDVESLREHYAMTLRHWVRRLEARHDEAVALVGEPTYRVWRLYMSGAAHGFANGRLSLMQTLLGKPAADGSLDIPLTRTDLYA